MIPSHGNQLTDLQSKPSQWVLHARSVDIKPVNSLIKIYVVIRWCSCFSLRSIIRGFLLAYNLSLHFIWCDNIAVEYKFCVLRHWKYDTEILRTENRIPRNLKRL